MLIDYVKKVAAEKSCKYGEYGSFEHLLFLLLPGKSWLGGRGGRER